MLESPPTGFVRGVRLSFHFAVASVRPRRSVRSGSSALVPFCHGVGSATAFGSFGEFVTRSILPWRRFGDGVRFVRGVRHSSHFAMASVRRRRSVRSGSLALVRFCRGVGMATAFGSFGESVTRSILPWRRYGDGVRFVRGVWHSFDFAVASVRPRRSVRSGSSATDGAAHPGLRIVELPRIVEEASRILRPYYRSRSARLFRLVRTGADAGRLRPTRAWATQLPITSLPRDDRSTSGTSTRPSPR